MKEKKRKNSVTRGRAAARGDTGRGRGPTRGRTEDGRGGRSTSVAAAATSTLIDSTSYHLHQRNVMNSRFVDPTAKITEECRPIRQPADPPIGSSSVAPHAWPSGLSSTFQPNEGTCLPLGPWLLSFLVTWKPC